MKITGHLFLLVVSLFLMSCSSIFQKKSYEKNDIKNEAANRSKTANQLLKSYEYNKAIDYLKESLRYNIISDNIGGVITNYADIGKVYLFLKDTRTAVDYYSQGLELAIKENRNNIYRKEYAYLLNGIGEAYLFIKDYTSAEKFLKMAIENESDEENRAIILLNLGKLHRDKNDQEQSLKYFLDSLKIFERLYQAYELENIQNLSLNYYSIGKRYYRLKNYNTSLEYFKKALTIDRMIENPIGIADDYFAIGKLTELKSIKESIPFYLKAKGIYHYLGDIDQYIEINKILIPYYTGINDYPKIYELNTEVFRVSQNIEERKNAAREILEMLKQDLYRNLLTPTQLKEAVGKYELFLKNNP